MIILAFIVVCALSILLSSLLSIAIGYICGWIASVLFGKIICAGFAIFGIMITPDKLPLIGAFLCWIGSFFRSTNSGNTTIEKPSKD